MIIKYDKINIGDLVKIIHPGDLYDSYDEMAKILRAICWDRGCKNISGSFNTLKNKIGIIINKIQITSWDNFYLVRIGNFEYIFGDDAFTLLPNKEVKPFPIVDWLKNSGVRI